MKQTHKILLAEDEPMLGKIVKESLESRGFEVVHCKDGEQALTAYQAESPALLVLDVMMPKLDGFTLAKQIRQENPNIPIIFLTAKSRTQDVVEGFEHGGNDYLKKPFSMEELIVRMNALLERNLGQATTTKTDEIRVGKFTFSPSRQSLSIGNESETLTHRETEVLLRLAQKPNTLIEKKDILTQIWESDDFYASRNLDVYITKLRKKLKADPKLEIINVRGYGYKLVVG